MFGYTRTISSVAPSERNIIGLSPLTRQIGQRTWPQSKSDRVKERRGQRRSKTSGTESAGNKATARFA
jgi:hypothetical protein